MQYQKKLSIEFILYANKQATTWAFIESVKPFFVDAIHAHSFYAYWEKNYTRNIHAHLCPLAYPTAARDP